MEHCNHYNIVLVEEVPRGNGFTQPTKTYVKCEDCNTILPILRITKERIIVDLYITE